MGYHTLGCGGLHGAGGGGGGGGTNIKVGRGYFDFSQLFGSV